MSISVVNCYFLGVKNWERKKGKKEEEGGGGLWGVRVESILCLVLLGDFGWRESLGL